MSSCARFGCTAPTLDESNPNHGIVNRDGTPFRSAYCVEHLAIDADQAVAYGTFIQAQLLRLAQIPGQEPLFEVGS